MHTDVGQKGEGSDYHFSAMEILNLYGTQKSISHIRNIQVLDVCLSRASLLILLFSSNTNTRYLPTHTTYQHTLPTNTHYLPTHATYQHTLPTNTHYLPTHATYQHTLPTNTHYLPTHTTYQHTLHNIYICMCTSLVVRLCTWVHCVAGSFHFKSNNICTSCF